jgi:hypothetical protein
MNLQLLYPIKNRPKKLEKCKIKLPQKTNTEIITSFPRKKEITTFYIFEMHELP